MSQEWATPFYHSHAWLRNRRAYMQKPVDTPYGVVPPGLCERCYEHGRVEPAKVVHHIVHLTPQNIDDPSVTLSFSNFQRLCQDCHAVVHGKQPDRPRVSFDADGNVVWNEGEMR